MLEEPYLKKSLSRHHLTYEFNSTLPEDLTLPLRQVCKNVLSLWRHVTILALCDGHRYSVMSKQRSCNLHLFARCQRVSESCNVQDKCLIMPWLLILICVVPWARSHIYHKTAKVPAAFTYWECVHISQKKIHISGFMSSGATHYKDLVAELANIAFYCLWI